LELYKINIVPRIRPSSINHQERYTLLDELWSMIALLDDIDEVRNFFRDLLSETEAVMLARRIRIAKLLLENNSYADIHEKTQAAPSTIASVQRWLEGQNGGYRKSLPKLQKEVKRRGQVALKSRAGMEPYSLEWMKKKYPLHFLISNAIDEYKLKAPRRLRGKTRR